MRDDLTRRRLLAGAAGVAATLAGCSGGGTTGETPTPNEGGEMTPTRNGAETTPTPLSNWRTASLTDVLTGESFSIDGLAGPVVLETFAVWCPTCTEQQKELGQLRDTELSLVTLNTDPNEDAEKVRRHAEEHGFDWRYAVAPAAYTKALVDEFGTAVTVAPRTPVIVICDDGTATFLDNAGIETADRIRSEAANC
ncbi:MAG: TlpA family protein disulfide reductase [Salinirussus sp.]